MSPFHLTISEPFTNNKCSFSASQWLGKYFHLQTEKLRNREVMWLGYGHKGSVSEMGIETRSPDSYTVYLTTRSCYFPLKHTLYNTDI